jgi:mevalonate kinase
MINYYSDSLGDRDMRINNETYYGKILLFGEYSVIFDSMGLTIPYTHFRGELSYMFAEKYTDLDFAVASNKSLREYLKHLRYLDSMKELKFKMDFETFEEDIEKGLYFESSIPQGYGLGSSGALVVAIYNKYAIDPIVPNRNMKSSVLLEAKEIFSQMESYFHGKSSGLDPLNCFIQFPLLIHNKKHISTVGIPRRNNGDSAIFLLNTHQVGKTEPLVNYFLDQCKNEEYLEKVKEEFIPANNACIKSLVRGEVDELFTSLEKLSRFELENLEPMIPDKFKGLWNYGLNTGSYTLKLCGSGGGGFLLGFTKNYTQARKELEDLQQEVITVYRSRN